MIALTDRQRAVLRAALEARVGRDLTPTEQRELGEALAGHLELAGAWGRDLRAELVRALGREADWERMHERAVLAEDAVRDDLRAANARADEWATRCRAAGDARDAAVARIAELERDAEHIRELCKARPGVSACAAVRALEDDRSATEIDLTRAEARIDELERELAALRQPAPAEPARVPLAPGQYAAGARGDVCPEGFIRGEGWCQCPEVDEPPQGDARDPVADPQIGDAWVRGWERRTVEAVERIEGHEARVVFSGGVTPTPISVWRRHGWEPAQGEGGAR